jgi:hypothetical protein
MRSSSGVLVYYQSARTADSDAAGKDVPLAPCQQVVELRAESSPANARCQCADGVVHTLNLQGTLHNLRHRHSRLHWALRILVQGTSTEAVSSRRDAERPY